MKVLGAFSKSQNKSLQRKQYTGWPTKYHTIDCTHNTFLMLQKHLTSGTELILIGWKNFLMNVCKLSVCKEPTLYRSVQEKVSEPLLHSLFLHKTIQLSLLIYSQLPVVRHFTNWWRLSHFSWTTAFTGTFPTSILWCYNFNGMIKWYEISCATLYVPHNITGSMEICRP